jgi:hypothetical protein
MSRDGGVTPVFPPLDHALVKAVACELVAETQQPLSRQSLADITARARTALGNSISRSTVWRMLATDAIKPWRYKYWIFPRDPRFADKAGPILDLYAGTWQGEPLAPRTTSSAPTRRRASKPASAVTRPCLPRQADRRASNTSTRAVARCNIWRPGMSAEGT